MFEASFVYHIYNRANGDENLFREERNYYFFLDKYFHHIDPIAETYAFCLMPNHFHFMIKVREEKDILRRLDLQNFQNKSRNQTDLSGFVSKQFSNLFNSYTKALNKTYKRHGNLFQRPFKSKKVLHDSYFTQLIIYIHRNPVKHGFVQDPVDWPYSSIHQFINSDGKQRSVISDTSRQAVIDWFGTNLKVI